MNRLKKIVLFVASAALLWGPSAVASARGAARTADSLQRVLPSLEGDARLRVLLKIAKAVRDAGAGMEAEEAAAADLLGEARLQRDKNMEAEALWLLLICYNNHNDKVRFLALSDRASRFYLDNGFKEYYWEYLFLEVNLLHTASDEDKVLALIGELYDRAKAMHYAYGLALSSCHMGRAYQIANEQSSARAAFLEAWSYVKQIEDPQRRAKLVYFCGQALVSSYNATQEYDRSLAVLDEWSRNIEACREWALKNDESLFTSDVSRIHCDMIRAETLAHLGKTREADACLSRVAAEVDDYPPLVRNYYLQTKLIVLRAEGAYEEALAVNAQLKGYYAERGEVHMYHSMAIDRFDLLKSMGRYEEAVAAGDELLELSDSLYNTEHLKQLNELRTIYEVDKLEAQKQRQKLVILFVSTACMMLGVLIAVYVVYSRNLRRKNLMLYNQIRKMTRAEKETASMLGLVPDAELSRGMKLFRELTRLMNAEKLFLDPQIDRRSVAVRLGTNESYLAGAIHEGADDATFANYISGLRLAYSLELLSRHPRMMLEAVAEQSGFASYSPFFRSFVRKYGMSPSEYRKLYAAKSE